MLILAVDSSAVTASVAVTENDSLVADFIINAGLTHSQTLLPMIETTLKTIGKNVKDIDLIGVTVGPGSFTGIRIGASLVKGISFTRNIPCVPVSTLECIARSMSDFDGIVCAAMDARCKQVYNAIFDVKDGTFTRICDDRAIKLDELENELKRFEDRRIYFVGDGAKLCFETFTKLKNKYIPKTILRYQNALHVAEIAYIRYNKGEYISGGKLVPEYLRLSQAERERLDRLKKQ